MYVSAAQLHATERLESVADYLVARIASLGNEAVSPSTVAARAKKLQADPSQRLKRSCEEVGADHTRQANRAAVQQRRKALEGVLVKFFPNRARRAQRKRARLAAQRHPAGMIVTPARVSDLRQIRIGPGRES